MNAKMSGFGWFSKFKAPSIVEDPLKLENAGEGAQPLRLLACGHVFHVSSQFGLIFELNLQSSVLASILG
jgi:hypothetical protein